MFIWRVFSQPDKWGEFFKRYISEVVKLVIDSIPLVLIISVFIGEEITEILEAIEAGVKYNGRQVHN